MLFNSIHFIFLFLPVALAGFFLFGSLGLRHAAIAWAFLASLVFYGWEDPWRLLPLILASATFNFLVGRTLAQARARWLLVLGVGGNLLLLGYFKYAAFLMRTLSSLSGLDIPAVEIPLPIGISFYTFTQIAFLVDAYRREAREYAPLKYGLFVTYFPHLVAGPILHHKEMMPQFDDPAIFRPRLAALAHGLAWFAAGLFKKVMLADSVGRFVDAPFKAAESGAAMAAADAWVGVLAYTLQIYFDFSAYSDMAIGLALMMGITFPLNFNSPYKAVSLIDFWRRWHMTLSRFLKDYLYIPLGGGRKGPLRRYRNLMITMVLGGLWHGATWNFALWGAIHGGALASNHLWRAVVRRTGIQVPRVLAWTLTLLVVIVAWVPFRAEGFEASWTLWKSMVGAGEGTAGPSVSLMPAVAWIVVLSAVALFAPNTQEIFARDWRAPSILRMRWQPTPVWAAVIGCLFGIAVAGMISKPTTFLYFRF